STDGGTSWQNSLQWVWVSCMAVDPVVAGRAYTGTSSGIYATTNGGSSWFTMNDGLGVTTVECLALDTVHNILYAGTNGGGVFRLSLSTEVEKRSSRTASPVQCVLHQNYPNPFNNSTLIRYEFRERMRVRLEILDLHGRVIRVLSDALEGPGAGRAIWDGTDDSGGSVPSGLYFTVLRMNGLRMVRKLIFQK
ncbi:MAG TPA: hypothetical protein VGB38_07035, partial [bacterium]